MWTCIPYNLTFCNLPPVYLTFNEMYFEIHFKKFNSTGYAFKILLFIFEVKYLFVTSGGKSDKFHIPKKNSLLIFGAIFGACFDQWRQH